MAFHTLIKTKLLLCHLSRISVGEYRWWPSMHTCTRTHLTHEWCHMTNGINLPLQVSPLYPGTHAHDTAFVTTLHVPPLSQGELSQMLPITYKHFTVHVYMYSRQNIFNLYASFAYTLFFFSTNSDCSTMVHSGCVDLSLQDNDLVIVLYPCINWLYKR